MSKVDPQKLHDDIMNLANNQKNEAYSLINNLNYNFVYQNNSIFVNFKFVKKILNILPRGVISSNYANLIVDNKSLYLDHRITDDEKQNLMGDIYGSRQFSESPNIERLLKLRWPINDKCIVLIPTDNWPKKMQ